MGLSTEDAEHISNVGKWFYGTPPHAVNEAVGDVLAEMVKKVLEGSHMMDLVPRPPAGPPGWAWLVSQGVQIWWRTHHGERIYQTVKDAVAWGYRSEYEIAQNS
jgi:hypothetical protein